MTTRYDYVVTDGVTNLYRIAAKEYGDATKFVGLCQANMLPTPFIYKPVIIGLPVTLPDTDGAPDQPKGPGTGVVQTIATYPYEQTTTIRDDGFVTFRYPQGSIVSWSTYNGNSAQLQVAPKGVLYGVSFVTLSNVDARTLTAKWTSLDLTDESILYTLQRSPSGTGTWTDVVSTHGFTAQVGDLTPNTAYDFRVLPSNSLGRSVADPPVASIVTTIFEVNASV